MRLRAVSRSAIRGASGSSRPDPGDQPDERRRAQHQAQLDHDQPGQDDGRAGAPGAGGRHERSGGRQRRAEHQPAPPRPGDAAPAGQGGDHVLAGGDERRDQRGQHPGDHGERGDGGQRLGKHPVAAGAGAGQALEQRAAGRGGGDPERDTGRRPPPSPAPRRRRARCGAGAPGCRRWRRPARGRGGGGGRRPRTPARPAARPPASPGRPPARRHPAADRSRLRTRGYRSAWLGGCASTCRETATSPWVLSCLTCAQVSGPGVSTSHRWFCRSSGSAWRGGAPGRRTIVVALRARGTPTMPTTVEGAAAVGQPHGAADAGAEPAGRRLGQRDLVGAGRRPAGQLRYDAAGQRVGDVQHPGAQVPDPGRGVHGQGAPLITDGRGARRQQRQQPLGAGRAGRLGRLRRWPGSRRHPRGRALLDGPSCGQATSAWAVPISRSARSLGVSVNMS